jgi:hypothetical protein
MKELLEFENWASNVIDSTLLERDNKKDSGDAIKRELPKEQDIVFQAQRKYPDRPADQALNLYLADKLDDFEKRDLQQNQVINSQRRENEKLNTNLSSLQKEFQSIENTGKTTQSEIERLKQLSGQLKGDVEKRRVDTSEVQNLLAKVEQLQSKPGVNSEQYEQLKKQVQDFATKQVDPKKFAEFSDKIDRMSAQERISSENFEELQQSIADLEAKQIAGTELKGSLEQKIQRLSKEQEAETAALQQKIEDLEERTPIVDMEKLKVVQDKILQKEQELLDISNKIKQEKQAWRQDPEAQKYRQRVGKRSKQASTMIKNFIQKEFPEVQNKIQSKVEQIEQAKNELNHELDHVINYATDIQALKKETRALRTSIEMVSNAINSMSGSGEEIDYSVMDKSKSPSRSFDELMADIREKNKPSEVEPAVTESYKMNYSRKKSKFIMEEMPTIGNHSIPKWNLIYQDLQSKYGDNIEQIADPKEAEIVKEVPKLARYFWDVALTERQKNGIRGEAQGSNVVIVNALLGVCTYLVYTFGNRAATKVKEKTTLYMHLLFNAVEAEARNDNSSSEFGHSRIDGIEEAANKMVDYIIGEQVARWIK